MIRILTCILALAVSGAAGAWIIDPAPSIEPSDTSAYAAQRQSPVSLEDATKLAQRRYPGRVVRAETVSRGGRRIHNIRILDADGNVRNVRIDAQTGAFL